MPEIIRYQDQWSDPDSPSKLSLRAALEEIARNVGANDSKYDSPNSGTKALLNRPRRLNFAAANVTGLITTGLKGLADAKAAGFTARNGDFTWTIRWDWDPEKGEHVNLMIKGPQGTDKFAFLSRTRHATHPPETAAYWQTIDRFTMDCGWSKETYDLLPGTEKENYRKYCAAKGHHMWAVRILGIDGKPEIECEPRSLFQILYNVNTS